MAERERDCYVTENAASEEGILSPEQADTSYLLD